MMSCDGEVLHDVLDEEEEGAMREGAAPSLESLNGADHLFEIDQWTGYRQVSYELVRRWKRICK
jgi:hypothetical protein